MEKKERKACDDGADRLSVYMGIEVICFFYVAVHSVNENTEKISILIGILTVMVILMYVIISGCRGNRKKAADMQLYIKEQIKKGNEGIIESIKTEEKYLKEQIQLIDNELFREYLNDSKGDNNKILRYLFEDRKKRAGKLNIKLDINWNDNIQQSDKRIVPIWDMVSIISNLLDNGLEAVWENEAEKRWISLSGSIERDCLNIEALNPYDRKIRIIDGEIKTTKNDEDNHGMGLKIIRDISEKYGMVMNVSTVNNIFKVSITKNEGKHMNIND